MKKQKKSREEFLTNCLAMKNNCISLIMEEEEREEEFYEQTRKVN